jgi:pilus assembly protein Flp/PilA
VVERAARATEKGWSMFLRQFIRAQVWRSTVRDRLLEARGATAVEYALMLALIAMVIFASVAFLGTQTNEPFQNVDFTPP